MYDLISGTSATDEDVVLSGDDKSGMLNKLIHYALCLWAMIMTFDNHCAHFFFSADKARFENSTAILTRRFTRNSGCRRGRRHRRHRRRQRQRHV